MGFFLGGGGRVVAFFVCFCFVLDFGVVCFGGFWVGGVKPIQNIASLYAENTFDGIKKTTTRPK